MYRKETFANGFGKPLDFSIDHPYVVELTFACMEPRDVYEFLVACKGARMYKITQYGWEGAQDTFYEMRFIDRDDAIQFRLMI